MRRVRLARRRRGLSSVVGAIFLVLIIVAGFNLVSTGLVYYENYSAVLSEKSRVEWERINERIELVDFGVSSGKFNLTVQNTGSLTVHLVRLWVTNETASPMWHDKFDIDFYVAPKGVVTDIGQALSLYVNSSAGYILKVVTERGSMSSFRVVPPSELVSSMSLHVLPPSPVNGTQVGVLFTVTNNATSADALINLVPQINVTIPSTAIATLVEGPKPSSVEALPRGSTAFFKWIYEIGGDKGDVIIFNASLVDGPSANFVTANASVHVVQYAEQSAISIEAENLNMGTPNFEGKVYWHKPAELDGYQMDPQSPFGQEKKVLLKAGTPTVRFYTMNSTEQTDIPAGNWTIDFHYKPKKKDNQIQLRILYQITSNNGSSVIQTLANYTVTLVQDDTDLVYTDSRPLSAINVTAGDRLRASLTWLTGEDVEIKFDKDNRDSFLQTPIPSPFFPAYLVFSGEDFWVTLTNSADTPFWIKQSTRAVLQNLTSINQTYASVPYQWKSINATQPEQFDADKDSKLLLSTDSIRLHFSRPTTIPTKNGDQGDPILPGSYILYIHLVGYDASGAFITIIIAIGPINF